MDSVLGAEMRMIHLCHTVLMTCVSWILHSALSSANVKPILCGPDDVCGCSVDYALGAEKCDCCCEFNQFLRSV